MYSEVPFCVEFLYSNLKITQETEFRYFFKVLL